MSVSSAAAYLYASAAAGLAILLRLELDGSVEGVQFIAFFPAVLIVAFLWGTGPGVATAVLTGMASWYFIVPPRSSWVIANSAQMHALAIYFCVGPIGAIAVGAMRRAMTRQRIAEARQQLLIAELQHRTRNLLAVVRSIAEQTRKASGSLDIFIVRFASRLAALSRVQSLLSRGEERIELSELVRSELAAHNADNDGERVRISGPQVCLPPQAVQVVALAVHELATNAVKYGALSQDSGRLSILWMPTGPARHPSVTLDWVESGVRLPQDAARSFGFGRRLIEAALPYELGAKTSFEFTEDGVRCRIELPIGAGD